MLSPVTVTVLYSDTDNTVADSELESESERWPCGSGPGAQRRVPCQNHAVTAAAWPAQGGQDSGMVACDSNKLLFWAQVAVIQ